MSKTPTRPEPVEELITRHLDLWTSALKNRSTAGRGNSKKIELYGINKLRELILELAMRGLLMPQDPNDEPASELLKKIAADKARLIEEGNVKQGKALPTVDGHNQQILPLGWSWSCMAELGEIAPRNKVSDNAVASFVPMPLISTRFDGQHEQELKAWTEIKKGYTHFADGDIAIAKITPCFENSKAAIFSGLSNGVGAGTTELHVARPYGEYVNRNFLLLYLKSPKFLSVGETKMTGSAGQKRVPTEFFAFNPLPLPPFNEQHRIVAKVDELMVLCDQLDQQTEASLTAHQTLVETLLNALTTIDQSNTDKAASQQLFQQAWQRIADHFDILFTTEQSIDRLKQTILQLAVMGKLVPQDPNDEPASELLTNIAAQKTQLVKEGKIKKEKPLPPITEKEKPFALPEGWAFCRLQMLVSILGDGLHGTPTYDENGEYFFINGNNLSNGLITIKPGTKRVNLAEYEKNKKDLNANTVLVSINGTIGNIAFFNQEPVILGKSACYFNLLSGTEKLFIKRVIESPIFFRYALSQATGSTISNLGLKAMNYFPVPVPPTSEQNRIIAKVDELMALCEQLKACLNHAQVTQLQLADAITERTLAS